MYEVMTMWHTDYKERKYRLRCKEDGFHRRVTNVSIMNGVGAVIMGDNG